MKLNPHYSTLEQLPLIREKRVREDRILYGHGKAKRKSGNTGYGKAPAAKAFQRYL
jgi:hypothetical protein